MGSDLLPNEGSNNKVTLGHKGSDNTVVWSTLTNKNTILGVISILNLGQRK